MIRLFAAIHVPDEIGEALLARQEGIPGAAWRDLEAFHITLRFFGEIPENQAEDLDSELAAVGGPALDLELAGAGCFGAGERINAVWAGVAENADLPQLAKRCEGAARRAGLAPETRNYLPHVTLAYLRKPNPLEVAQWIQANNLLRSPAFPVRSFGLYSSRRTAEGSRYRLEAEYPRLFISSG